MAIDSTLPNFRSLNPQERLAHICKAVGLDDAQYSQLAKPGALPLETANGMIENVIGTFDPTFGTPSDLSNGFFFRERQIQLALRFDF